MPRRPADLVVACSVTAEEYHDLHRYAQGKGLRLAQLLRRAINEHLDRAGANICLLEERRRWTTQLRRKAETDGRD